VIFWKTNKTFLHGALCALFFPRKTNSVHTPIMEILWLELDI
jgi:hypothetical protein